MSQHTGSRELAGLKEQRIKTKEESVQQAGGQFDSLVVKKGKTQAKTYGGRGFSGIKSKHTKQPEQPEAEFSAAEFCTVQVKEEFECGSDQLEEEIQDTEMEVGKTQHNIDAQENGPSQIEFEFEIK
jgi:hypothetical protein